jgi:AcrR family transcriptional regulator
LGGTLYHYFANKAELLQVLREGFEKEIMRRVRSRVESCPADDWRGRLKAWIDAAVDGYFEMIELHDVVIYGLGMPFRHAMADAEISRYLAKGSRKNKITFYPSRLQVIFARSGGGKILERACYSCGFATPGANKSNPNPNA